MRSQLRLTISAVLVSALAASAPAQEPAVVQAPSIGPREQAVYDALLAAWLGAKHGRQLVSQELSVAPLVTDPDVKECAKGLHFLPVPPSHPSGKSLAGAHFTTGGIDLIDPSHWSAHDPSQGIAAGKSVESAVKEGFSHSLISLSEIAFTKDGKDALVSFGIVCGSLCGSGATQRLHRAGEHWAIVKTCGNWIS